MKKIKLITNKIYYPVLTSICFFFQHYIYFTTPELTHFLPFLFGLLFPLLFGIIPEVISKYIMLNQFKRKQPTYSVYVNKANAFSKVTISLINYKAITLWVLLIGLCRFISDFFLRFFMNIHIEGFTMPVLYSYIIATWGLNYLFFSNKVGRHRIVAICCLGCLCLIECLTFSSSLNNYILKNFKTFEVFFVFLFLEAVTLSTKEVVEKHLMMNHFMSPYILLFYQGVIALVLFICFHLFINNSPCSIFDTFEKMCTVNRWSYFSKNFLALFNYSSISSFRGWCFILSGAILNGFRIYMSKELTPTHRYISEDMSNFYFLLYQLYRTIRKDENCNPLKNVIGLLVIELFALMAYFLFNEHIIIYWLGLHVDTKEAIEKRALDDQTMCMNIDLSLLKDS